MYINKRALTKQESSNKEEIGELKEGRERESTGVL
jgi:hypothetical protein